MPATTARPIAFILAASNHGPMIVNRNDHHSSPSGEGYGVGHQILTKSSFDPEEVNFVLHLLNARRHHHGDGVFALDGGANIGVHTIEWARHMHGWGEVLAFEAQEVVFYALAGNLALNNCFNARARCAALGAQSGEMRVPRPDYLKPASFGSLEMRRRDSTEYIGQAISYEDKDCTTVPVVTIDSLKLPRLDFFKLDVEGMESEVLAGARETLRRCRPLLLVEVIKSDFEALREQLFDLGYEVYVLGINLLAVHVDDPIFDRVQVEGNVFTLHDPE